MIGEVIANQTALSSVLVLHVKEHELLRLILGGLVVRQLESHQITALSRYPCNEKIRLDLNDISLQCG